jgi:hypothetical protein
MDSPREIAVVVLICAVTAVVVASLLGWKPLAAEPNYTTWCDNPSHNRLYQSTRGSIAVVPADKSC